MKGTLKWAAIVAAVIVVVVIGALLIIPYFIDASRFKAPLEKYVSEATGRPVSVGDDIHLSLFPWAGASFSNLRIGNSPQFAEKDFLTVKSAEARVKLMPLLSKEVLVDRIIINEPRIYLVTNKDGRVSWDFGKKAAEAKSSPKSETTPQGGLPIASLLVEKINVSNGHLEIIDHRAASRQEISGLNLAIEDVSFDRPVHLTFAATVNQKPVSAEGRFGPVGQNLGQGSIPLELKASVFGQLALQAKGAVANVLVAPAASLTLDVAEFSPRKLVAEIGQSLPATTDPKVLDRVALKTAVKADARAVELTDGVLALDDSTLNFTLKAKDFSKPDLAFDLKLDQINLDRYLPPKAQTASGQPSAAPAPEPAAKKTDFTPIRKLVLNGKAAIGKLVVSNAKIEDASFTITAKDGLVSLDPLRLNLYQGTAAGKTVVNVKGDSPATSVQLALDKVQVNPLLKDVVDRDFLEGMLKAQIALSMTGDDAARIKQTLNGRGDLNFSDGAIVGVDLAGMVRNVKAALGGEVKSGPRPRTDFSELTVPFTMENGVFRTTESSLKSPLLRLVAGGSADLVKETLDFRVEPKLVGTIKGQGDTQDRSGLTVPVLVSGTFSKPVFRPDVESIAKDQLKKALSPSDADSAPIQQKATDLLKGILPRKK